MIRDRFCEKARRVRAFSCRLPAAALLVAWVAAAAAGPEDFHRAVRLAEPAGVDAWLAAGGDADVHDRNGRTALQVAVRYGHADLVVMLIERGARVNATDADGWTALHYAAQAGDLALVEVLLAAGGDVNLTDGYRYAPLHLAAREGRERVCLRLLEAGARADARIDVGMTAADLAEDRYPDLAQTLRARE